jgi:hypothetical protein
MVFQQKHGEIVRFQPIFFDAAAFFNSLKRLIGYDRGSGLERYE